MVEKKKKDKKPAKKIQIELTSPSLFLWGFVLFFLLTWIFVLGIFVGRGFLPGTLIAISGLKNQINKIQGIISHDRSPVSKSKAQPEPDPKLAFYDTLSNKKDEAKSNREPENEKKVPKSPAAPSVEPVKEAIKKENQTESVKDPDPPEKESQGKQFTVQLASLEELGKAQKMINELNNRGFEAYYYETKVKGKTYYRVRCGKFVNRSDAQILAQKLEKERGMKGFVSKLE